VDVYWDTVYGRHVQCVYTECSGGGRWCLHGDGAVHTDRQVNADRKCRLMNCLFLQSTTTTTDSATAGSLTVRTRSSSLADARLTAAACISNGAATYVQSERLLKANVRESGESGQKVGHPPGQQPPPLPANQTPT